MLLGEYVEYAGLMSFTTAVTLQVYSSVSAAVRQVLKPFLFIYGSRLFNSFTPRVKPWAIQSFLSFDSMDRILKYDHLLESC